MLKTLNVTNVGECVPEGLLYDIFAHFGPLAKLERVFDDVSGQPTTRVKVEFHDVQPAQQSMAALQGRNIMGSEIKITWMQTTTGSAAAPGVAAAPGEPTESFCVFVGNLNPDMDEKEFRNAFTPFGCIDARMITEPGNPHKKLHYGFVDFADKENAERAISVMNGEFLGGRLIRVTFGNNQGQQTVRSSSGVGADYDSVVKQTDSSKTTVYVGSVSALLDEDKIRQAFCKYGSITTIRMHSDKGFAFVEFKTHEEAAQAICGMQGVRLDSEKRLRCSWAKTGVSGATPSVPPAQVASSPRPPVYDAAPAYTAPPPGYEGYNAPPPGYGGTPSGYGHPPPGYGGPPPPGYGPPPGMGYGPPPGHGGYPPRGPPPPGYGGPGYGPPPGGYGPPPGYGGPPPGAPGYGGPPPGAPGYGGPPPGAPGYGGPPPGANGPPGGYGDYGPPGGGYGPPGHGPPGHGPPGHGPPGGYGTPGHGPPGGDYGPPGKGGGRGGDYGPPGKGGGRGGDYGPPGHADYGPPGHPDYGPPGGHGGHYGPPGGHGPPSGEYGPPGKGGGRGGDYGPPGGGEHNSGPVRGGSGGRNGDRERERDERYKPY